MGLHECISRQLYEIAHDVTQYDEHFIVEKADLMKYGATLFLLNNSLFDQNVPQLHASSQSLSSTELINNQIVRKTLIHFCKKKQKPDQLFP